MSLLFSIPILSEEIIGALSRTLLHSLWQGMVLSIVAATIIFFTKKTTSTFRYNLLTAALLAFVIAIAATFTIQVTKSKQVADAMQAIDPGTITVAGFSPSTLVESRLSITGKAIVFFNDHANWIVMAWLLIICLRCIRLTGALYGVYQLKRRKIFSAGETWDSRIAELRTQLMISKPIRLLQSGIVKVPAVIGFFKPVILFPAGMLASLPVSEVEAILLHELAHIRRRDYLVNMLQNVIEIIFFFNLPVLWVSALIKKERENCCDDIAVSQTDSKRNYINALIAFEELNLQLTSSLVSAFPGEKNHLRNRVKRIIYNNNQTLNNMEKKLLAAGMIITSVFIFAFTSHKTEQKQLHSNKQAIAIPIAEPVVNPLPVVIDTVPVQDVSRDHERTIIISANGKKYIIVSKNNKVTELHVNGKKIPSEKISDYANITNKLIEQSKLDEVQAEQDMEQSKIEMEQSQKELIQSQKEMELSKIEMEQSKIEMEQSKKELAESQKEMQLSKIEMEQSKKEMQRDMEQAKKEMEAAKKAFARGKIGTAQYKKMMALDMVQAKKNMVQAKKEMYKSQMQMKESMIAMEKSKEDMLKSEKVREEIISDLIKENIITDKKDLSSFKLTGDELIVNGVKQPDVIHKKLKDKFVQGKSWSIMYNN